MAETLSLIPLTYSEVECLDRGFVRLVDVMPRFGPEGTADYAVVQAARVSYGDGAKNRSDDRTLIRYLMRHRHTSPFEQVEFKFHCKMPIFVARQWIRHRTASVNEKSGRYSIITSDEYFVPEIDTITSQSQANKQGGSGDVIADAKEARALMDEESSGAFVAYQDRLKSGMRKELARVNLPLSTYTEWYWKIDLHNLLHFLALRCDSHAQLEMRVFADAMLELIRHVVPVCVEAWEDYHPARGAMLLTRLEVEALRFALIRAADGRGALPASPIVSDNARESSEWTAKANKLGLQVVEG